MPKISLFCNCSPKISQSFFFTIAKNLTNSFDHLSDFLYLYPNRIKTGVGFGKKMYLCNCIAAEDMWHG